MRRVKNIRNMADGEKHLAMTVFRHTIHYDRVVISDGLGYDNRPVTLPTSLPVSPVLNVPRDAGDYVIHAGDGYYGMSKLPNDRATLIHELTHVWQGEHQYGNAAFYAFIGLVTQAGSGDPYAYDPEHLNPDWESYGMEQQAHIVEDWFTNNKQEYDPETGLGDKRFYYIKANIRGEKVTYNWLSPRVTPLPGATLAHDWSRESEAIRARQDALLTPILKARFAQQDSDGPAARVKQLEGIFSKMDGLEAAELWKRLQGRHVGDEVVRYFFANLSLHSTSKLMTILKGRGFGFV